MKRIAIFIAMLAEAEPIIARYGMVPDQSGLKQAESFIRIYTCQYKNVEILLVTPGIDLRYQVDRVAPVPAALAVWEIIHQLQPTILINAGTAGGFAEKGAQIGNVYLAKPPINYYDRRISLGNFKAYGMGSYDCLYPDKMAAKLGLKLATIWTGSSLDITSSDLAELKALQVELKEMEAAAVAEACYLSGFKPLLFIKVVTNLLDKQENSASQFQTNLALASQNLAEQLYRLIDLLIIESLYLSQT